MRLPPAPSLPRSRSCGQPASPAPASRARGFTLMELMIAVAIMGILAAVAIPNYREYVQRSRLVDATTSLSDFRVRMEQYFLDNRTYQKGGNCGVDNPVSTGKEAFKITCAAPDARTYTVTAEGIAGKAAGFKYTIDQSDARVTSEVPSGWSKSGTCWTIRKDGSCS
jgi:type IV pilus assembly protein PilE